MVPWRRHHCCQGDPELAQLPPDPSQDVCPCPECAVAISRALCLPRPASLIHGTPESQGLGPCSPLSSVCGPAETPGSLLASPSLQPLTKACCGMMLFPIKAGQVEEKEGGGHCILVSLRAVGMARCPESSCPLLYKYVHKVTCVSSPGSSQGEDPEQRSTAVPQLTWGQREGPISGNHLPWGTPT